MTITNGFANIDLDKMKDIKMDTAILGAGCFWCTEAIYQRLKGVSSVEVGYSGGDEPNPSYRQISTGKTDYIEVARIVYNPDVLSYEKLLEVFFTIHDPTSWDKQGADVGKQYRSVIIYENPHQKEIAESLIHKLNESGEYKKKIVTEVVPYRNFYLAEDYHQNYYDDNKNAPYCSFVITPKLKKFESLFKNDLK